MLQAEDYTLSELTVESDDALVNYDLKDLIQEADVNSLQGFLLTQNIQSGSLLSKNTLISPKDPHFLVSTIDPKQEVAYRIYVKSANRYILDTLQNGSYASIYSQQQAKGRDSADRTDLVKIIDKALVLYGKSYTAEEQEQAKNTDTVGYISMKLDANSVKELYSLAKDADLIVLPTNKEAAVTNHRGTFIRKLRGQ